MRSTHGRGKRGKGKARGRNLAVDEAWALGLVRRLAREPEGAGRPHADRMVGALLLADISGFMAITARLAQRGA